jgi:hypothetical protein
MLKHAGLILSLILSIFACAATVAAAQSERTLSGTILTARGEAVAGGYRLDPEDARPRASGLDVLDLSLTKRLHRWLDFNLALDNLTDKRYCETQNYFESRLRRDAARRPPCASTERPARPPA